MDIPQPPQQINPLQPPIPTNIVTSSNRPQQVKWFEIILYISAAVTLVNSLLNSFYNYSFWGLIVGLSTSIPGTTLWLFLLFFTARRRANWARIILSILLILGILSSLTTGAYLLISPADLTLLPNIGLIMGFSIVNMALHIISLILLFSKASNAWFKVQSATTPQPIGTVPDDKTWRKIIPVTNIIFLIISIALVFGPDLAILMGARDLLPLWIEMLIVFVVLILFIFYENFVARRKFSKSTSPLDTGIMVLVLLRNVVFVLNFIPFIQIIGALITVVGIIPYLIVYLMLISKRGKIS